MLWALSLFLPTYTTVLEYSDGVPLIEQQIDKTPGFMWFLIGWAAPLQIIDWSPVFAAPDPEWIPTELSAFLPPTETGALLAGFAWYANPLWAWSVYRILQGSRPAWLVALVSLILALPTLQPLQDRIFDAHGVNSAMMPAIGVYIWVVAISIPAAVTLLPSKRQS